MQVVANFKMPGKVYKTAMSSIARSHMLIATGTEDVQVRLCDIASGAFAHTLSGHRGMMTLLHVVNLFMPLFVACSPILTFCACSSNKKQTKNQFVTYIDLTGFILSFSLQFYYLNVFFTL